MAGEMSKAEHILGELLRTEESYLQTLCTLQSRFMEPLAAGPGSGTAGGGDGARRRRAAPLLGKEAVGDIFGNIAAITALNKELYRDLVLGLRAQGGEGAAGAPALEARLRAVAGAFVKFAPYLKIYAVYSRNYRHATRVLLEATRRSGALADFLETATRECKGLTLQSHLLTPVQRIPRCLRALATAYVTGDAQKSPLQTGTACSCRIWSRVRRRRRCRRSSARCARSWRPRTT